MSAGLETPVKLHGELMRRCRDAATPHAKSLSSGVLRSIELAEIALWVDNQDESVDAAALVRQVVAAVTAINGRYA